MSFFLWKSLPDAELLALAERGELRGPGVLAQQVRRLLADPKAARWMNDFVGQWLTVRNIQAHDPSADLFREFDDNLRAAMARETELFFEHQVREDRNVLDLLRDDSTFLNARLARHYGVPHVYGSHFRRVHDAGSRAPWPVGTRQHLLTVTSYADRTSVVLRGKVGARDATRRTAAAAAAAAAANVPELEQNRFGQPPKSLRERMEQHRANPVCAGCHAPMDPMGFVLENFDATGQWRDTDAGAPIDASTTMSGGEMIDGPVGIREYLLSRQDEFLRTVTEKLLVYALGRGLEYYDAPTVRQLVRHAADEDYRWSSLILGIVDSVPFQMRTMTP